MRTEFLFVLAIVVGLVALTALRYRKQLAAGIRFARILNEAKTAAGRNRTVAGEPAAVPLVNCSKCGVWVPRGKATTDSKGESSCAACLQHSDNPR
ncbi:MAG: hypothetical protein WKF34_03820 [Pyrinomonadaceae bacterium]